jgi:hypothetical protein
MMKSVISVLVAMLFAAAVCVAQPKGGGNDPNAGGTGSGRSPAGGTEGGAAGAKGAAPAPAPAQPGDVADSIVPELSLQGVQLRDMVEFLQDTVPNFKAVVFRDPGVPDDEPTVTLRLKKVALSQILALLTTAYPNLEIQEIGGAGGTIYCIKVHSRNTEVQLQPGGGPAAGPGMGAAAFGGGAVMAGMPMMAASGVKVYPLTETVEGLISAKPEPPKDRAAAGKEALNQVLSLIKATMAQATESGTAAPTLQLHEETQTLIFKGTPAQREALESVLAALPTRSPAVNEANKWKSTAQAVEEKYRIELTRRERQAEDARMEADRLRKLLEDREQQSIKQAQDIERLRVRLEEIERQQQQQPPKKTPQQQ